MFVLLVGEQNTEIRDETPTNTAISVYRNRQHLTVTLYESTVNVLRIHLDCGQQYEDNSIDNGCSLAYHLDLWIDLNDDQIFHQTENRIHRQSLIQVKGLRGTYDLEVSIPKIDNTNTKIGPHRLRISLMPTQHYQNQCGKTDSSETREYTVNILNKPICQGKKYPHSSHK